MALCHDTKVVELFHKIIFLFFILCNFYSALFLFLLLLFTGNAREKLRKIRLKHFENAPPFEKSTNEDIFSTVEVYRHDRCGVLRSVGKRNLWKHARFSHVLPRRSAKRGHLGIKTLEDVWNMFLTSWRILENYYRYCELYCRGEIPFHFLKKV